MNGLTLSRPGFLLLLAVVGPAVILAWRRWPPPLSPLRSRLALGLRLFLVLLVVLALADVRVRRRPEHRAVVAVVDLSDSTRASRDQAADVVRELIDSKGRQDLFGVVSFGRDAQVEVPASANPSFPGFQTRPDPTYSNIAGALSLAANLIPDGYSRQVVVVTDGRQNLGDAAQTVAELRRRSVRVDVAGMGAPAPDDAAVVALEAPSEARVDQPLVATARVRSATETKATITLSLSGSQVERREVTLPAGVSEQAFEVASPGAGTHELRVDLDPGPDTYSQNNTAAAVVKVLGQPVVLVLEGTEGTGAGLAAMLESTGMVVERRSAETAPTEVAQLSRYDTIVVDNAANEAFAPGAMEAIASAVSDLGRGLVATGGALSYGPGGWKDTPLEEVLPVRMELRQPDKPSVAVMLLMETLEDPYYDGLALGAAGAVVDQLGPADELGVMNMSTSSLSPDDQVVALGPVTDRDEAKRRTGEANLGDPPNYSESIAIAIDMLKASPAAVKHIVVIGDGDALGDVGLPHAGILGPGVDFKLPDYGPQLGAARRAGITTSAVGAATHAPQEYMDHMKAIATAGGGGFGLANSPADVPKLLLSQVRSNLRPWFEQAPFFPKVTSAGDLLAGVVLDAFPQLGGYVVTTAKPTAEVLLSSPKGDPVLAATQSGLGRTVAWTPDTQGRWTAGLLRSPLAPTLFGRMVAWTLPNRGSEAVRIDAGLRGDGLDVTVTGPAEGAQLEAQSIGPDGETTPLSLRPVGPGQWRGAVPAADVGTYLLRAVVKREGSVIAQQELSVPVPYSPEYLDVGRDDHLLGQLAAQGGAVLDRAAQAWSVPGLAAEVSSPMFWLVLVLGAIAWPIDVALRRLTVSPARIVVMARAIRAKRQEARAQPAESTSRLQRDVLELRRQRQSTPPTDAEPPPPKPKDHSDDALARLVEARRGSRPTRKDDDS